MKMPDLIATVKVGVQQSGLTASFFNFFQGRATFFAIVFTVCGIILAFRGKLDANYSLFVTAVQGLIFAHSCKEDWHEQRMAVLAQREQQRSPLTPASQSMQTSSSGTTLE